jgi:uncharacterized membrane protein YgcG
MTKPPVDAYAPAFDSWLRRMIMMTALATTLVLVCAGSLLLTPVAHAQGATGQQTQMFQSSTIPERLDDRSVRVYDTARVLTEDEVKSLEGDMERARTVGIEMLVYTRRSADTEPQSEAFADALRTQWGVASNQDADDGIVYLLTINPTDPERSAVTVSTGERTLPIRQMDQAALQAVIDDDMMPRIEDKEYADALYFGVRRVLNFAEYSPPEPKPLTSRQDALGKAANILAAGLVQVTLIGYLLVAVIREGRIALVPNRRSLAIYAVSIGALAVVTGIIAIAGRNPTGALVALAVTLWAAFGVPLVAGRSGPPLARVSTSRVPPRVLQEPVGPQRDGSAIGHVNG